MAEFTDQQRKDLAKRGLAMPDGGYPIRSRRDLQNAIAAYGRGKNKPEIKKWIKKRAKELDALYLLPENWEVEDDDDFLAHYGVKGMKWGIRRYQNEDGSLTSLGKKRKTYLDAKDKASSDPYNSKKSIELKFARNEYNDQKIRENLKAQNKKSKRQETLEKQYREQGYNKDDAEIQAYKRARTERVLAVAGAMTLAAIGAYAAYKHYDNVTDRLIKAGAELGRISSNDTKGVKDAFYAFANQHDEKRYTGLYGHHTMNVAGQAFKKNMSVGNLGIKVASRESARKAMEDLYKTDDDYRKLVEGLLGKYRNTLGGKSGDAVRKSYNDISKGKGVTNRVYDAMNVLLADHAPEGNQASRKFYDKLISQGYSAVRDVNDVKFSGYGARNPLIVFDNSKIRVESVKKLGRDEVNKLNRREYSKIFARASGEQLITSTAKSSPYLAIPVGLLAYSSTSDNRYVRDYYRDHPDSKLSRNEILKMRDEELDRGGE